MIIVLTPASRRARYHVSGVGDWETKIYFFKKKERSKTTSSEFGQHLRFSLKMEGSNEGEAMEDTAMDVTQNSDGEERLDPSVVSSVGQGKVLETREHKEERRIGDKRKHGGEELLVPTVGKEREAGPENREARADGGGSEEQTKWAHLEFEDGQKIVPLKNSVSTSFYIGRQPSTHEHYHQFHHEDDNLCLHISRAHCHILRLDTGSFSSYNLSLDLVLLI